MVSVVVMVVVGMRAWSDTLKTARTVMAEVAKAGIKTMAGMARAAPIVIVVVIAGTTVQLGRFGLIRSGDPKGGKTGQIAAAASVEGMVKPRARFNRCHWVKPQFFSTMWLKMVSEDPLTVGHQGHLQGLITPTRFLRIQFHSSRL